MLAPPRLNGLCSPAHHPDSMLVPARVRAAVAVAAPVEVAAVRAPAQVLLTVARASRWLLRRATARAPIMHPQACVAVCACPHAERTARSSRAGHPRRGLPLAFGLRRTFIPRGFHCPRRREVSLPPGLLRVSLPPASGVSVPLACRTRHCPPRVSLPPVPRGFASSRASEGFIAPSARGFGSPGMPHAPLPPEGFIALGAERPRCLPDF